MKQSNENKLIEIIYETVEKFIGDWRNSPYEWETEIDIQCEIANRLRQLIKSWGLLILKASYDYIRNGRQQEYSRVCCEPGTNYNDSNRDGSRNDCKPDIVVYDDIDDPDNPPDLTPERNWPMLWACEIKYQTEDNCVSQNWDIEKMKYLLKQDETKYACCLYFNRKGINMNPIKPAEDENHKFRSYTVLPEK